MIGSSSLHDDQGHRSKDEGLGFERSPSGHRQPLAESTELLHVCARQQRSPSSHYWRGRALCCPQRAHDARASQAKHPIERKKFLPVEGGNLKLWHGEMPLPHSNFLMFPDSHVKCHAELHTGNATAIDAGFALCMQASIERPCIQMSHRKSSDHHHRRNKCSAIH